MEKKVVVRIKVEYNEFIGQGPCNAEITAIFPHGVPAIVYSQQEKFFFEHLLPNWGYPCEDEADEVDKRGRKTSYLISAPNWEELEEKVEKFIEEQIEILNQVKKKNEKASERRPTDRSEIYIL